MSLVAILPQHGWCQAREFAAKIAHEFNFCAESGGKSHFFLDQGRKISFQKEWGFALVESIRAALGFCYIRPLPRWQLQA